MLADTNVTDWGRKPAGTGPPAGPAGTVVVVELDDVTPAEGEVVVDEVDAVRWPAPPPDEQEARMRAAPAALAARRHLEEIRWGTTAD